MGIIINILLLFVVLTMLSALGLLQYRKRRGRQARKKSRDMELRGGISELRRVTLNRCEQMTFMEGINRKNPVCLFLHGGPGLPAPFGANSRSLYPEITSKAVAVYWDQRGSGKSYGNHILPEDLTIEQLLSDANELVDYLRDEFQQEKIYLVGSYSGTILGMKLVERYPEKFHGYFAYTQMVNIQEAECLAYDWLVKELSWNKGKTLKKLKDMGKPPYRNEKKKEFFMDTLKENSEAYNKRINGKNGSSMTKRMAGLLFSPDYELRELWDTVLPALELNMKKSSLMKEMQEVDFLSSIQELNVPVYLIHGKHDMRAPLELTEKFYDQLQAPHKEMIVLKESAHYPSDDDMKELCRIIGERVGLLEKVEQRELQQA